MLLRALQCILVLLYLLNVSAEPKKFLIDICSYNNKNWYKENLMSVFKQTYDGYRVIYTNDCSTDGTGELVDALVKEMEMEDRCLIVHNKKQQRMLSNHWRVIHQAASDEIIIHLDGDDWFIDENVLEKLNKVYQDDNVWMTFGSYLFWPSMQLYQLDRLPEKVIVENSYRRSNFKKSPYHPRTFYAWLAQEIRVEDLLFADHYYPGVFIPALSDWSLLYPMFEMAAGKAHFIKEPLYCFNVINPLNHDKDREKLRMQKICGAYISRKKSYHPLIGRPQRTEQAYEKFVVYALGGVAPQFSDEVIKNAIDALKKTQALFFVLEEKWRPFKAAWLYDANYAFLCGLNSSLKIPSVGLCRKEDLQEFVEYVTQGKTCASLAKEKVGLCCMHGSRIK